MDRPERPAAGRARDARSPGRANFVGRSSELDLLAARAARVKAGEPQLVWVEGEPGVGKTSLLKRFTSVLTGFTVLAATGDPTESMLGYGLIGQLVTGADSRVVKRFELFRAGLPREVTPVALGEQLLGLIGELQASRPVALAIDDLQWSDRLSAQALGFVLRRLAADQVMTVVATRTPDDDPDAYTAIRYLSRHRIDTSTIRLEGLSARDISTLSTLVTGHAVPVSTAARIQEYTGGNPLFVNSLLSEVNPRSLATADDALPVPRSLMTMVGQAVARLPEPSRRLVEALAVLGGRCPLARVAQLAAVEHPNEALAPALDAGLVHWSPSDPTNQVEMRHALYRDAVYEMLGPVRRAELHAGAAGLVDHSSAWAHRVAATSVTDAALAAELEREAARVAATAQHEAAARHLRWAAGLSPSRPEYERRFLTACVQTALTPYPGWVVNQQAEMQRCEDSALRSCALGLTMLFGAGDLAAAETWLTRTLHDADGVPGQDGIRCTAASALAALHLWRGRSAEVLAASGIALSSPEVPSRLRDYVRVFRVVARSRQDGLRAGFAELAHLPARAASVPVTDLDCLSCRGGLHVMLGEYTAAIDDLATVVRHQRAHADIMGGPAPYCYLAATHYVLGDWNDAAIAAERAVELQEMYEQPPHHNLARLAATLVPAGRGDFATAESHAGAARKLAEELGTPQDLRYAAIAAAVLARAKGDHAEMLDALRLVEGPDWDGPRPGHHWWDSWWHALFVEALIGTGGLDEAEGELRSFTSATTEIGHREDGLSRHRAALAARRGRTEEALEICAAGVADRPAGSRPVLPRAMLEHDHGRLLLAAGYRTEAATWLSRAYQRFDGLGARPFADRVAADLRVFGPRGARRMTNRVAKLTEREGQVSHLIARDLTNSEIAAELYVTTKTVEFHLSNIYAKLGVGSRREVRKVLDQL